MKGSLTTDYEVNEVPEGLCRLQMIYRLYFFVCHDGVTNSYVVLCLYISENMFYATFI